MRRRLFLSLGLSVAAAVLLPAAASGAPAITELGSVTDGKPPRCPDACSVITRTTAMPTSVAGNRKLYTAPSAGRIVAWSITLGAPNEADRTALEKQLDRAEAQLVVLRRGKSVTGTIRAVSPLKHLDPYFGSEVTFALPETIAVRKGDMIGLSIPSWAPVLVQGYDNKTSWRASRPRGRCGGTTDARKKDYYVDTTLAAGRSGTFNCLYKGERLAYSATFIPSPKRTDKGDKAKAKTTKKKQR